MSVKIKSTFFDQKVGVWHAIRTTLLLCLLLVCGQVSAQTTAKGTVTDQTGEPVIGATVVEKGNAKNAAVTDFDGNFTLKLQKSKTVVISYIGMVTQEVTASENMQVKLQDDNASLEEVVVVGPVRSVPSVVPNWLWFLYHLQQKLWLVKLQVCR